MLILSRNSFGMQKKENSFIIWAISVRWSIYAELNFVHKTALFDNLRSRKKRRRIDLLFNLLKDVVDKMKFEKNKIYNRINRENLRELIRYSCRRKKG
jgi:hypothetical protein